MLRRAAEGSDPTEIAAAMHLSVGTVRNDPTTIVTKLNARNRVDAIKSAYEAGWLPYRSGGRPGQAVPLAVRERGLQRGPQPADLRPGRAELAAEA